jgi:hypothetical protein
VGTGVGAGVGANATAFTAVGPLMLETEGLYTPLPATALISAERSAVSALVDVLCRFWLMLSAEPPSGMPMKQSARTVPVKRLPTISPNRRVATTSMATETRLSGTAATAATLLTTAVLTTVSVEKATGSSTSISNETDSATLVSVKVVVSVVDVMVMLDVAVLVVTVI